MSAIVAIWIFIIVARLVLPAIWNAVTNAGPLRDEWQRRGKVAGHRGPGPRSFKGRAGRREWWLSTLGNAVVSVIVGAVPAIGTLLTLPWVVATLAVNARRLHDLSLSAWLQLVPMAFGFAAAFFYFQLGGPDNPPTTSWTFATPEGQFTLLAAATALVYLGFYGLVGFAPGRGGPNAYGEADAA
ncbi:MAG TPA: DUF805 domain-containing protein [Vitreimonas sp.]|uniref:DUF805 domain-containing protein n=1 Tax=Vitreimonas sp. TaxID=3069702 RepID=UPI002D3180B6|nr:DUF805 domain-containing protein [Vitreimonas sp.]HYD86086.1 DUF805 domain-containing protein [Vitreimonas sp.]